MNQPRKLEIQLMVDHPILSVGELEKFLTLSADESWEVGERYKPSRHASEQQYQFSRWAIRERASSLDELSLAILRLTSRIQGIKDKLHSLPADARVSLTLFVTETDTVIGMGIAPVTIKLLAEMNAGIEVSLIVSKKRAQSHF